MLLNLNSGRPKSSSELNSLACTRTACSEFRYRRDAEIFGEAEPVDYVYQIVKGAVRSYKLLADGRRQISAFHLPGDVFGIENGEVHRFTAEAVVDTTVLLVRRQDSEGIVREDASIIQEILGLMTKNLVHAEDHMLLLGRKSSLERVVAFLIEMDRRLTATGVMELPMARRDIADYLGLTLETVSRALSTLQREGVLSFIGKTQRQIVLLDRNRLIQLDTEGCAEKP
jgi:CRP/FNR family nitrogen fixation transcriptional regulator